VADVSAKNCADRRFISTFSPVSKHGNSCLCHTEYDGTLCALVIRIENVTMVKKIAYSLVVIVAIIVIIAVILLLPPHLQIRRFDSSLPSIEQLESQLASTTGPSAISYVTTASQILPTGTLGHIGVLLQWPDGRTFLIDAGMNESDAMAFGKTMETVLGAAASQTFGPIEQQMEADINSISGIAFTHLHSDHTLGISDICAAQGEPATIFQTRNQAENQNHLTESGQQLIEASNCSAQLIGELSIKTIPGFEGLVAIAGGGHTPGSTIYATTIDGKIWLFAGDISNVMDNLIHNKGKGFIYSYLLIPEDTNRLEQLRLWLGNINQLPNASVLVAHDLDAWNNSGIARWQGDNMAESQ